MVAARVQGYEIEAPKRDAATHNAVAREPRSSSTSLPLYLRCGCRTTAMQAVRQSFKKLLPEIAATPDKSGVDALITKTLEETQPSVKLTSENWKASWEYALREEVFRVSVRSKRWPYGGCRA